MDRAKRASESELKKLKEAAQQQQQQGGASEEEMQKLQQERDELKSRLDQVVMESEAIVKECLEEKKRMASSAASGGAGVAGLNEAIESLRKQLSAQKDIVTKFEAKVKRREAEIKEKTQELRKQRADTANAKLQVTKLTQERDEMAGRLGGLETAAEERERLAKEVEALRVSCARAKEEVEDRDSELEAKATEVDVLKETVEQLKMYAGNSENKPKNGRKEENEDGADDEDGDGWDIDDDPRKTIFSFAGLASLKQVFPNSVSSDAAPPDLSAIQDTAQLKVDLRKAQSACEKLSEQLVQAESAKEEMESRLSSQTEELEVARRAKDNSVREKAEMGKKLDVLTAYFNQRESDLQKQLGVTSNRLTDTESVSESSSKRIAALTEEVESLRAQQKTLKGEMEEQERSLKSQVIILSSLLIKSNMFRFVECGDGAQAARVLGDGAAGVSQV